MPSLELIDETFDINSSENYELSVQLSPFGFTYSILDTIRNRYVLLRSTEPDDKKPLTPEKAGEMFSSDNFPSGRFKKVNLVLPSPKSTLVPSPLFDPEKKEDYFTLNLIKDEGEVILYNWIPEPDAFIVFAAPAFFVELAGKYLPDVTPSHHTRPLIDQVTHSSKNDFGLFIQVHLEKDYFNLLVLEHGSLKFMNTFNYKTINDVLYYLFNVYKNMGINREETVWFSGLTKKHDDLHSQVLHYLKNIKFSVPEGNFSFSYVFNDIELHRYINLFSITGCE